ncbi:MAG: hypothetical protein PUD07_00330 [bacterium]|nr:hypothetical protein [bacterium]
MEIIVLIIIIGVLSIVMFLSLKKLIESINKESQNYYFKNMQEMDSKIDEKNKKLLKKDEEKIDVENKKDVIEEKSLDKELLDIYNHTDYEKENALKVANKVEEIFNIDEEKVLKNFIKNISIDENNKIYQSILDRFSPNLIYKLKMLNKESQINEISKMLSDEEYNVFHDYIETHKFRLNKFLLDLNLIIERTNPVIEVLTGNKNKNYNYISPYIKTIYSDDVYKGIIIKYQDKIYDYSINERDV